MRPPESWRQARATLAIAAVTAAVWLIVSSLGFDTMAAIRGGFIPARLGLSGASPMAPLWLTPLTATLLHANWIHIGFNLLILVFCGRAVEGVLGPVNLFVLYVVGAYAAAAGHFMMNPESQVPMIGASGAVSAVLGAFAMLFGRNKVKVSNPTLALWLNALWLLAAWIALQLVVGIILGGAGIGIAVAAHVGGFLVGLLLAYPLLLIRYRRA